MSVIDNRNLLVATLTLSGAPMSRFEDRNIRPAGAQSEHTRHQADDDEEQQTYRRPVDFPVDDLTSAFFRIHSIDSQSR